MRLGALAMTAASMLGGAWARDGEPPLRYAVEVSQEYFGNRGVCIGFPEIPKDSLVTGYFVVSNPHSNVRTSVLIYEGGNQPFSLQDLNGEARFSFRSRAEPALYEACVRPLPKTAGTVAPNTFVDVKLALEFKFDTFDEKTAKELVLQPIEREFYQLEESIARLGKELNAFVLNEEQLRDTNENTLDRLRIFALLSVLALVSLGIYQIFYMKRFFKTKKLI